MFNDKLIFYPNHKIIRCWTFGSVPVVVVIFSRTTQVIRNHFSRKKPYIVITFSEYPRAFVLHPQSFISYQKHLLDCAICFYPCAANNLTIW